MATRKCKGVGMLERSQVSGAAAEQAVSAPVPLLPDTVGGARDKEDRPTKLWLLKNTEWKFVDKLDALLTEVRRKMDMKSKQEGWISR